MQTREQVIKGLECISGAVVWCAHCPYSSVDGSGRGERCKRDAAKDALALLKAQETCEDAVNRKDVINVIKSPCDMRYINGNWQPCIGDYIEAINNLPAAAPKAQEPRVMTLEEVQKTPYTKPTYLELLKSDVHMALISPIQKMRVKGYVEMYTDDEDVGLLNYEMYLKESYGKTWRCWTSRPTNSQREATPWVG